ncbi:MAG TPA: hypothetical protein VGC76_17160 [Pyrinomonadaceae bacterium]|jgi:hypothetical protein
MKKLVRQISVFCVLLFVYIAFAIPADACSCVRSGTVDTEFEETPNVVVLKLRSVEKYADGEKGYGYGGVKQSKLTVEKVFKGNLKVGQELTFAQGGGADCIWTFSEEAIGTEFLFYLGEKPKNNLWTAGTCSRSNAAKYAAADLLYLEKLGKVKGQTRLSGALTQIFESAVKGEESDYKLLAGRKILVSGNGKNIELKTDENGVYEIYDLPAGKYKITPEKIAGYQFTDEKSGSFEVEIKAKNHTEQDFRFTIRNAVRGKLFDAGGKPLKDVCLHLLPARGEKAEYFYQGDCTDESGKFEFSEIPAGTYVIVVNDDGKITSDEPFGTFYYPSAARREDAAEITVSAGDFFENLIINAPQTAEVVVYSGVLLFENGKPANKENAEYASINFVADNEENKADGEVDARALTDEKGRFSIRILKGQKGRLFGSLMTYEEEYENCPKLQKLIREKGGSIVNIETPAVEIEAINDLSGIELKFPFPNCKKAKID